MLQLDVLRAEPELATAARSEEDLAHGHLGREAQSIGRRRTIADDGFAALVGPLLDDLGDGGRSPAELALYRQDVSAPAARTSSPLRARRDSV